MSPENCTYCHAPDNGTCAYPGENKFGCLLDAHRERVRLQMAMGFGVGQPVSPEYVPPEVERLRAQLLELNKALGLPRDNSDNDLRVQTAIRLRAGLLPRREYHANGTYWNAVPTVDMPCDVCQRSFLAHAPVTQACPAELEIAHAQARKWLAALIKLVGSKDPHTHRIAYDALLP